ncbi:Peroxisomal multifunctional enzyme type 2 [Halotydeus destructor]|nr:Peroxisomal multifunctional enzyme type 2 [Halotydeus destructor]
MADKLRFDGRVAIVTGAGGGLGREYALLLAERGASVVVNDLGGSRSGEGSSQKAADLVVNEIKAKGGKAVADYNSVEEGDKIVKTAIDTFGRIDILINNAGILRDKSILKTTIEDWDLIHRVHLRAVFITCKAAWPYFKEQKFGRIIVTASTAGIYGNFGQANYSAAKIGLIGLSNTLSVEGSKYNIHSNAIVPVAGSRLTEDILPENLWKTLKPQFVAPVVGWLAHETCPDSGGVYEAAGGWIGKYRWSRSLGKAFVPPENLTLEGVRDSWSEITDLTNATQPASVHEQMSQLVNLLSGDAPARPSPSGGPSGGKYPMTYTDEDEAAMHSYQVDDLILYALSVGATTADPENLRFLYENSEDFQALPTYGVVPCLGSLLNANLISSGLKKYNIEFNPAKFLHGEQYLELQEPLPLSGNFKSDARIIDVLDKGSGALVIMEVDTFDDTGKKICYNQFALFLIGSGNFGGPKMSDKAQVRPIVEPPKRPADVTVLEQTSADQAALYRLNGDKNPLHIDPSFAAVGGFEKPILHGLCTLGYASRHVLRHFGSNDAKKVKAIKARFAGTLVPGQTLQTDMWREGNRVHFECKCKETGKPVISGAYVDFIGDIVPLAASGGPIPTSVSDPENPTPAELAFDTDDDDALLTDVVFEEIGRRISMAPELAKKVNGIFTFVIVKDRKEVKVWTMDMKTFCPGRMYVGHSTEAPADCIIRITDQDMCALAVGELDPVRAFMTGKLKIKGNLMATQRLQVLFELNSIEMYENDTQLTGGNKKVEAASGSGEKMQFAPSLADRWGDLSRLVSAGSQQPVHQGPEFVEPHHDNGQWSAAAYEGDSGFSSPTFMAAAGGDGGDGSGAIGPIVDLLFEKWLPTRLDDMKELVPVIKTVYQWNILQKGIVVSTWTLDLKNGGGAIHRGTPKTGKADCILSIEDDNAIKIFEGKEDAMRSFMSGKLKITGNVMAAQKLQQVWGDEAETVRKFLADLKSGKVAGGAPAAPAAASGEEDVDVAAVPVTGIKADIFFNIFEKRCHEEPDFMQRLRVAFQFNITKDSKPVCIWTADNKTTAEIQLYRSPPKGIKPDVTCTVEDDDLLKILTGRVNPQRLFMMGRVRVKGNIMLLQKLNGLWSEFQKLGKTPELPLIVEVMLDDPMIPGLKSESLVIDCIQRLMRVPEFATQAPGYHQLDITDKSGKIVSQWTLDLVEKKNYVRGLPKKGGATADSKLTLEDTDFARLVLMKVKLSDAIARGMVKFEGSDKVVKLYEKVFSTPTSLKPKL